jgi:hypothetical protein
VTCSPEGAVVPTGKAETNFAVSRAGRRERRKTEYPIKSVRARYGGTIVGDRDVKRSGVDDAVRLRGASRHGERSCAQRREGRQALNIGFSDLSFHFFMVFTDQLSGVPRDCRTRSSDSSKHPHGSVRRS